MPPKSTSAKPPTLADVARLAGVSVPTASRVLNGGIRGDNSGTSELRQRVRSAARRLSYAPNPAAQTIKEGRGKSIALLVGDIEDQGAATMIAGVMHAAERRGLSVAVRATGDDADREKKVLEALRGERHRGIIVATSRTTNKARESAARKDLQVLSDEGARVVVIGNSTLGFPSVFVDNVSAAAGLAIGLVDAGVRRFAILAGPDDQITSRDRVSGFLSGLERRGIDRNSVQVIHADFSRDGGYAGFCELEDRVHELDVVAAMSDAMAVGAIVRARELSIGLPGQLEITGFDHVPVIGDLLPGFSTVAVPLEAFGEAAVSLAIAPLAMKVDAVTLNATPIVRGRVVE